VIHPPAPDKECVAKPVEIAQRIVVPPLLPGKGDKKPFGTPAYRSAEVEFRIETRGAREDERSQGMQVLIGGVDLMFQTFDVGACHTWLPGMNVLGQRGQNGAQIEKFVLYTLQGEDESA
jgi:hypothetical protein